jgi:hypothetical protein
LPVVRQPCPAGARLPFQAVTLRTIAANRLALALPAAPRHAGSDQTLKFVNFIMRPHLDSDYFPGITLERMARVAATSDVPLYVTDDQGAVVVVDGAVKVVSEGKWKVFAPKGAASEAERGNSGTVRGIPPRPL